MVIMIVEITQTRLAVQRAVQSAKVLNFSVKKISNVCITVGFAMAKMIAVMEQMREGAVSIIVKYFKSVLRSKT